jgi:hypothetical protein
MPLVHTWHRAIILYRIAMDSDPYKGVQLYRYSCIPAAAYRYAYPYPYSYFGRTAACRVEFARGIPRGICEPRTHASGEGSMLRHWPSEAHNRQQQRNENPVNPADDQSSRAYVLTYCIDCMVTSLTYITGSSRAHNSTPPHPVRGYHRGYTSHGCHGLRPATASPRTGPVLPAHRAHCGGRP